ncbi:hypothetical protein TVAG_084470 [Trichomonas vaginalis G3]|uniref:Uncharacterized protein n=1 Tax=Trichomonas vaginalis (strain ATCC PRA-98 / G3) TaxID=412133 RepID=A2G0V0_TRIV3|nr:hypothetical protein TVAGG3_0293880 [Trichomonas vaginalis G3]EAX89216.1 hypothetical protein TVAG_084470 [Trichomonas vaginalis G3]KAI5527472.1 hypothetical protein TVAGG3_0293880 [Trichomonas vaginalis G3]|eukprot:XP_001302146.1 hypothetical protein [Trichomonas vaginalis G3]
MTFVSQIELNNDLCTSQISKHDIDNVNVDLTQVGNPYEYIRFKICGKVNGKEVVLTPHGGWYIMNLKTSQLFECIAASYNCEYIYLKMDRKMLPGGTWVSDASRRSIKYNNMDSGFYMNYFQSKFDDEELKFKILTFEKQFKRLVESNSLQQKFQNFLWSTKMETTDEILEYLEFIVHESIYKFKYVLNGQNVRISTIYENLLNRIFGLSNLSYIIKSDVGSAYENTESGSITECTYSLRQFSNGFAKYIPLYKEKLNDTIQETKNLILLNRNEKNYVNQFLGRIYTLDKANRLMKVKKKRNASAHHSNYN